jgi:hypothetical protein
MGAKFKMAPETYIFVILLSKHQFFTDFKNLDCILELLFIDFFFSKIQNGEFFEDDVIFEKLFFSNRSFPP